MTLQEFDNNRYGAGDKAIYQGKEYLIASADFEERLFGLLLNIPGAEEGYISWVRCENCELVGGNSDSKNGRK